LLSDPSGDRIPEAGLTALAVIITQYKNKSSSIGKGPAFGIEALFRGEAALIAEW